MSCFHVEQFCSPQTPELSAVAADWIRSETVGLYQRRAGVLVHTKTTLVDSDGRVMSVAIQGTLIRGFKVRDPLTTIT